jgi:SNF family Na+-dependent transporter
MSNLLVLPERYVKWMLVILVVTAVALLLLFAYQPNLMAGLELIPNQIAGSCTVATATCNGSV